MTTLTLKNLLSPLGFVVAAVLVAAPTASAAPAFADTSPNAAMLRYPDVSAEHIAFVYANDVWLVPRAGGAAAPLASPPGVEQHPRFSADGKTIAFVGNYEGNRDIYTLPLSGGVPTRVTYHPAAESIADWTPDGRLLFISNGLAGLERQSQLFTTSAEGGMPEKLPVPYGGYGAISGDGQWLAYTLHSTDTRTWKRYRGGMATDVWLFNLKDKSSKRLTDWEGTDTLPMWTPGDSSVVYYLSDAGPEHRLNVWSFDVATATRKQVTTFPDDDVRWPSMGPGASGGAASATNGAIIFQLGAKLMLLELASGQANEVKVTIPGDRPRVKPRLVNTAGLASSGSISPTGKRVVLEARGDIWSLASKEGISRNMTRTVGEAERDPAWSPDGRWVAYFSDAGGEYDLYVRPADSRPAPDDKDKEKNKDKAKDDGKKDAALPPPLPREWSDAEPRKLSDLGPGFRYSPTWSPDSKHIAFCDQNGRMFITEMEGGETKEFDKDPWMNQSAFSWSHDSAWITYSRADSDNQNGCIWVYNIKTGEKTQATASMFDAGNPAFDRKGDWLFFSSRRSITSPTYSDLDATFVYDDSAVLLMAPLRKDVKSPWLSKSDEEVLKKDEPKKDDSKKEEKKDDGDKPDAPDDGVSGTWEADASGGELPPGGLVFTLKFKLSADGKLTGTVSSVMGEGEGSGTYDRGSGALEFTANVGGGNVTLSGTVKGEEASGTWTVNDDSGKWTARRTARPEPEEKADKDDEPGDDKKPDEKAADDKTGDGKKPDEKKDDKKDEKKELKIEFEGLEARAIQLPVPPGSFSRMVVADGEKLVYGRTGTRGNGEAGIKVYNYKDDEKEEKAVTAFGSFDLSADGKKLLVMRGSSATVVDAAAGGGKAQPVSTGAMTVTIDPRAEWKQIFNDAWRLQRDFFYESTLHGVDWERMRKHYGAMIEECASREDVAWVLGEMISELNIGHAYIQGVGDGESQPTQNVGMLGCDFELDRSGAEPAYKIVRIIRGGPWDSDAVGPLSEPGIDVKEGDYLLEVNGQPMDTAKDPWAAFIGLAGRATYLTVSDKPTLDSSARLVIVKPDDGEAGLRFRNWIESKRKYVEERSGGKVGYVYVPNTGVNGQSELFRQFFGQRHKQALIIDERWNGGGQLPHRFIELLNRPPMNYWARRDGNDWPSPDPSHQGPKCMLVNGLAGSGGDMFPWLFREHKLGKIIGTRTWGGLVGISGNPRFIDGGGMSVPTFGFYKLDGHWGVEGHGVDPDIEVIDDPALMWNGGDPQLDAGIDQMLGEIPTKAFKPPTRPAGPNRAKMGIPPADR